MTDKAEFIKARDWRVRNELSINQLSEAVGFSPEVIYAHERQGKPELIVGRPRTRKKERAPTEFAWLRYKRVCGDLDAELNGRAKGKVFSW